MAKWLAKEFDWDTGKYTGNYYDIAEAGIVAVFVDSFYGDDSNAGTAVAPYKTLGAAITYLNTNGADGSRIFMNGIFSETLPAQTYWYDFIGCGGGWNGRTLFFKNQATEDRIIANRVNVRWQNIQLLGYDDATFITAGGNVYFNNCFLQNFRGSQNFSYYTRANNCIIVNMSRSTPSGSSSGIYNSCIIYNASSADTKRYDILGTNNYISEHPDSTGEIRNDSSYSVKNINAHFINPSENDFNVRITSPLIGAGPVDEISGNPTNIGGVSLGLPYNGLLIEFTTAGGATITDLTLDATGKYTITAPATSGTLETALMDLGNIYPLENIDLFNVFDFLSGEITQGVFETFSSPRMALTIKLKYGLTEAEVTECPWLFIEYGKQPTFSGTGASRVGNADATFDPDTFQEITCRYMKLFVTLQNNS